MKTVGIFEAKAKLSEICMQVSRDHEPVIVTRRGVPLVRIEPIEEKGGASEVWDIAAEYRKAHRVTEDLELPPEVALQPGKVRYRAGDHQLMSNVFVGNVHPPKDGADDVFTASQLVPGEEADGPVSATGCKMSYPS